MSNCDIANGIDMGDRERYLLYLRSETIKKIYNPLYIPDKSYDGYRNSKFCVIVGFNYSQYLAEAIIDIDKSISYTEYISESISGMEYSSYLAEKIDNAIITYNQA